MTYETAKISMSALMRPAFDAGVALTRLDERIARSPVGQGWIERTHFADACASLWIDGELVHLEDLVLHDATRDIRTPTHELTIARDVLRTRRRVAGQSPDWALSADGIRSLRKTAEITFADADDAQTTGTVRRAVASDPEGEGEREELNEKVDLLARARKKVQDEQPPDATDLLFSKTYFALEETGLGWPSFYGSEEYTPEKSKDDAMLRIFADAYRITPNPYMDEVKTVWSTAHEMLGRGDNRMRRLMSKLFPLQTEAECNLFLEKLRTKLRQTRLAGSIDISLLFFRAAKPTGAAWRCDRCGRVHLHEGFGKCTRCGEELKRPDDLTAEVIAKGNFLGRRVKRTIEADEPLFRLKCEELTGQTSDPAERLQQFKGVFVKGAKENDADFAWRKLFDTVDLLSVTTTMEVGVDIGSLGGRARNPS